MEVSNFSLPTVVKGQLTVRFGGSESGPCLLCNEGLIRERGSEVEGDATWEVRLREMHGSGIDVFYLGLMQR